MMGVSHVIYVLVAPPDSVQALSNIQHRGMEGLATHLVVTRTCYSDCPSVGGLAPSQQQSLSPAALPSPRGSLPQGEQIHRRKKGPGRPPEEAVRGGLVTFRTS